MVIRRLVFLAVAIVFSLGIIAMPLSINPADFSLDEKVAWAGKDKNKKKDKKGKMNKNDDRDDDDDDDKKKKKRGKKYDD